MDRTIVELTIPFTFIAGGEYMVAVDGKICVISINIEQNHELATMIYRNIQFMGNVTSYPADYHGLFEISRIVMEFPYLIQPTNGDQLFTSAETVCITYLNRLLNVVKYLTKKYWLSPLSPRDLFINNVETVPDKERPRKYQGIGPKFFNPFKLPITEQSQFKREIDQILLKEKTIPFFNSTFLESFNAFDTRRVKEAIILINAAFEGYVADFLKLRLIKKGYTENQAVKNVQRRFSREKGQQDCRRKRGLHKVLTIDFKDVIGKSLGSDDKDLWEKFVYARNKRKNAVHPYISQITEDDAYKTISHILEVMNWIKKQ